MAAYFGLVPHAAQGLANKLTTCRLGNRFTKGGLANTRRANEAQYWPLQLVRPRLHRKIFDDPVLNLFQSEVVGIKNVLRLGNIALQLGLFTPWNAQKRIKIITDDRGFCRHRRHPAQLFQFRIGFRFCFLGELHRVNLGLNFGNLVPAFAIIIAKLALNGLHLLIQIIFALRLFHLTLHTATDFLFDLQNAKLAFHEGKGHFKPAKRVGFNQQQLLVRNLQLNIRRNGVRKCRRGVNLGQLNSCLCGHFLVQFRIILELLGH